MQKLRNTFFYLDIYCVKENYWSGFYNCNLRKKNLALNFKEIKIWHLLWSTATEKIIMIMFLAISSRALPGTQQKKILKFKCNNIKFGNNLVHFRHSTNSK